MTGKRSPIPGGSHFAQLLAERMNQDPTAVTWRKARHLLSIDTWDEPMTRACESGNDYVQDEDIIVLRDRSRIIRPGRSSSGGSIASQSPLVRMILDRSRSTMMSSS